MKHQCFQFLMVVLVLLQATADAFAAASRPHRKGTDQRIPGNSASWSRTVPTHTKGSPRSTVSLQSSASNNNYSKKQFKHGLAILTMPFTSLDRIANEAILATALQHTSTKLSVVLQSFGKTPSLSSLRKYVGEVYSELWDVAMDKTNCDILDVVVYPQNLPNAAPEQWIHIVPDLDFVCSHNSICGWESEAASGRGNLYVDNEGLGGLDGHVRALNADRQARNLQPVTAIHVHPWPHGACARFHDDHNVVFIDDDALDEGILKPKIKEEENNQGSLLGGARIPSNSLFSSVCVGGTFDGMHYGHRKLLTLAVSSVQPITGKLLVGVTVDEMLQHKKYSEFIPSLKERMEGVRNFLHRLSPGMMNRVRIVPIVDSFGPPGAEDGGDFDALVLSHETLETGHMLNLHRVEKLGMKPLALLCTRRTEPYGMSSTALRRRQSESLERNRAGV